MYPKSDMHESCSKSRTNFSKIIAPEVFIKQIRYSKALS